MDSETHRELKVLEAIEANDRLTQRGLASQLGIALGLANLYLKRLAHKGYIKCVNVEPNRLRYLITPKGIVEKTRLTYEFMEYSVQLYRQSRRHLSKALQHFTNQQSARIAICGTGEAAELAYLCLKEHGIEPVAVFGWEAGAGFFSLPVLPIETHGSVAYDAVIVATLQDPTDMIARLEGAGVPRAKLVPLRQPIG